MKLYEISNEYNQFLQAVEDEEIPIEAVADTLEGIKGEFNEKADNIACMIKNQEAEMLAIKAEKDALNKREILFVLLHAGYRYGEIGNTEKCYFFQKVNIFVHS